MRLTAACRPSDSRIVEIEDLDGITRRLDVEDLPELAVRQHRARQDGAVGVFGSLLEHIHFRAQAGFQRHHDAFAQGVDGRVGDLRELLAEKVGDMAHAARQHGHRRVVPHGTDGFLAALGERADDLVALLEGDEEHFLVGLEPAVIGLRDQPLLGLIIVLDAHGFLAQPVLVGLGALQAIVDVCGL